MRIDKSHHWHWFRFTKITRLLFRMAVPICTLTNKWEGTHVLFLISALGLRCLLVTVSTLVNLILSIYLYIYIYIFLLC